MRRTEHEFKEELLRRSENFRRERVRKRKKLIGVGMCACICLVVLTVLAPFGGFTGDNAAPESEMILMDAVKSEDAAAPIAEAENMMPDANEALAECPAEAVSTVMISCGTEEIELDITDAKVICGFLNSGKWIMSAANCLCDYTLHVDGVVYRYHSDCGTIQDEYGRSMTLSETDKVTMNEIVARCPMRIE